MPLRSFIGLGLMAVLALFPSTALARSGHGGSHGHASHGSHHASASRHVRHAVRQVSTHFHAVSRARARGHVAVRRASFRSAAARRPAVAMRRGPAVVVRNGQLQYNHGYGAFNQPNVAVVGGGYYHPPYWGWNDCYPYAYGYPYGDLSFDQNWFEPLPSPESGAPGIEPVAPWSAEAEAPGQSYTLSGQVVSATGEMLTVRAANGTYAFSWDPQVAPVVSPGQRVRVTFTVTRGGGYAAEQVIRTR